LEVSFIPLNNLKSQIIDGLILLSSNAQKILQDFISQKKIHLNIDRKYIKKNSLEIFFSFLI